jgi:hypothetical protein
MRSEEQPINGKEDRELDRNQDQHIAPQDPRENGHGIIPVWRCAAPAMDANLGRPGKIHAAAPFRTGTLAPGTRLTNATIPPGRH